MPSTPSFPLVFGLVLLIPGYVGLAHAQGSPRSMSECERLKNDLAYNQCLSMFGPAAKNVAGGDTGGSGSVAPALPAAVAEVPIADEPAPEARRGRRYRRGSYTRGGRQSASFATGGETRPYRRYRRRRH